MDAEAIVCHIKRRFPNPPIILLSASSETPEQILWLVDEYVMKSEIPESLISILEWVWRLAPGSDEGAHRRQERGLLYCPLSGQSVLCCSALSNYFNSKARLSQ